MWSLSAAAAAKGCGILFSLSPRDERRRKSLLKGWRAVSSQHQIVLLCSAPLKKISSMSAVEPCAALETQQQGFKVPPLLSTLSCYHSQLVASFTVRVTRSASPRPFLFKKGKKKNFLFFKRLFIKNKFTSVQVVFVAGVCDVVACNELNRTHAVVFVLAAPMWVFTLIEWRCSAQQRALVFINRSQGRGQLHVYKSNQSPPSGIS